jgi:glucose-6-phosphate-specific signal transduction histidine kinase
MNFRRVSFILYIIFLGFALGAIAIAGAITAPVIFHANDFLAEDVLSHFQSGIIMTEIFVRLNYILFILVFFVLFMEIRDYLKFKRDAISLTFGFIVVFTALLFVLYYTPFILEAQAIGPAATQSEAFEGMHKGSELDFKILLFALLGLLVTKLVRVTK